MSLLWHIWPALTVLVPYMYRRGAANITHPSYDELVLGVPYQDASRITCEAAAAKSGLSLKYPWLPCVAVFQPKWADPDHQECRPGTQQDHYRVWPLELCM